MPSLPFQPCPGITTLAIQVENDAGDIGENILHFYKGSAVAWTLTELTNLVNAIDTWLTTGDGSHDYVKLLTDSATVTGLAARDLTTSSALVYSKSVSHAGTGGTAALAAGLAKAITLRTGQAGRSFRGRVFSMFLDASMTSDENTVGTSTLTAMVDTWGSLQAAVAAVNASWYWGVLSRVQNGSRLTDGAITKITSIGYSTATLDYQRRRAPFHGRHH